MENEKTSELTTDELKKIALKKAELVQEQLRVVVNSFEASLSAISGIPITNTVVSQEVSILEAAEITENLLSVTSLNLEILWGITKKSCGYTDKFLQEKEAEVAKKRRDYKLKCPTCQRVIGKGKSRCMYCGSVVKTDGIFSF